MVSVNPGTLATPVHNIGASTRVTVNLSGGGPFTRIVIFAPPANGPSILAITMTSPGHAAAFVHTAHTSSALADEWDDPPNGPFASPMSVIFPRFELPLSTTGRPVMAAAEGFEVGGVGGPAVGVGDGVVHVAARCGLVAAWEAAGQVAAAHEVGQCTGGGVAGFSWRIGRVDQRP